MRHLARPPACSAHPSCRGRVTEADFSPLSAGAVRLICNPFWARRELRGRRARPVDRAAMPRHSACRSLPPSAPCARQPTWDSPPTAAAFSAGDLEVGKAVRSHLPDSLRHWLHPGARTLSDVVEMRSMADRPHPANGAARRMKSGRIPPGPRSAKPSLLNYFPLPCGGVEGRDATARSGRGPDEGGQPQRDVPHHVYATTGLPRPNIFILDRLKIHPATTVRRNASFTIRGHPWFSEQTASPPRLILGPRVLIRPTHLHRPA